jgi:Alpha amylase, catalytic domain
MTWWSASCFYEVYVRSFQDSNNDGVGDLNGITSRLPYLQDLGIDAIWVTPFSIRRRRSTSATTSAITKRSIRRLAAWPTSIGCSRKRTGAGSA